MTSRALIFLFVMKYHIQLKGWSARVEFESSEGKRRKYTLNYMLC